MVCCLLSIGVEEETGIKENVNLFTRGVHLTLLELRQKIQELRDNEWELVDDRQTTISEANQLMSSASAFDKCLELLDFELASIQKRKKELNHEMKIEWGVKTNLNKVRLDELSRITGEKRLSTGSSEDSQKKGG